ncbi:UNVERIFIED_CONTAM: hypothetical protein NCL1_09519 [Trichonephila clavipes]
MDLARSEIRFSFYKIATPVLSLTLCQLERYWMALRLSDNIQMMFEPGIESTSLRPVSIAMSSLRKIEQHTIRVSQFNVTGIVLGLNGNTTARTIPVAISIY